MLTESGYDVIAVGSVGTAFQVLTTESPDLLIVSLDLEGGSGLQIVAVNPRSIPSVVVSSFTDALLEREARLLGAEFLVKPTSGELLDAITLKLATERVAPFDPPRRWTRRALRDGRHARVENWPARVLDISDGGVRLEVERGPGSWRRSRFACSCLIPTHR